MSTHITTARIEAGLMMEIPLTLKFRADDPVGVLMEFDTPESGLVEWWVARELLTEGLEGPAGSGDVQIWPVDSSKNRVYVALSSDEGDATLTVASHEIRTFLKGAAKVLPLGQETHLIHAELDNWLNDLLIAGE